MRKQVHWTTLAPWLVLTWCVAVTVNHFWTPDTWMRALGTGLIEIPIWLGIGYLILRRAERRAPAARSELDDLSSHKA